MTTPTPLARSTTAEDTRALLVALLLVASGMVVAAILLAGKGPLWLAGLLHAGPVALAAQAAQREPSSRARRTLWLLTVAYGGLGVVGAVGALVSLALGLIYERHATSADEWRRALFPDLEEDKDDALWALVGVRNAERSSPVAAFVDVIAHGSLAQKQAAVALIAKRFQPAFAPALRMALHDDQNAVRVQAATAVSIIEADATNTALVLERRRRERPDDPDVLLELARHEDHYAFSGLLDRVRELESRARAVDAFTAYLGLRPDDNPARHQLGRLYARLGRHAEALACFEAVLGRGGGFDVRMWALECLFQLRRFDDLRRMAAGSVDPVFGFESMPADARPVVQLWVRDSEAAS